MIKLITSNQNLCTLRQSRDLIYLFAGRPHHYSTVSYSICALLAPQSALLHRTIRKAPEERHDRRSSGTIRSAPVALKSAGRSAGHVPALLRAPHCNTNTVVGLEMVVPPVPARKIKVPTIFTKAMNEVEVTPNSDVPRNKSVLRAADGRLKTRLVNPGRM